jgi:multisubunit Na+/H+ antiporter MnhG subunit
MSKHILPTSGNLLGLCFAILSFIRVSGLANVTVIDEFIVVAIVLFLSASIVSYASMRSLKKGDYYERIAVAFPRFNGHTEELG